MSTLSVPVPKNLPIQKTLLGQLAERGEKINGVPPGAAPIFSVERESWDSLLQMKDASGQGAVDVAIELNKLIALINAGGLADDPEVKTVFAGVQRDLASHVSKIQTLWAQHKDKRGPLASADEYSEVMRIGLEYQQINEQLKGVLFQPLLIVQEHADVALRNFVARNGSTNPAVVTDVEAKPA